MQQKAAARSSSAPLAKAGIRRKARKLIVIPPEVKHWHGAKADSWFSHIALEVPGKDTSNEWCEPVDDAAYAALD